MNTYIDVLAYQRAPTGHDTSQLVGNVLTLGASAIVGATSLTVAPILIASQNVGDRFTIFDGSSSEVVVLTAISNVGATTISVSATQYAHASGVALCSDGPQGSLADEIVNASAEIENYCRQPLLQATISSEQLSL